MYSVLFYIYIKLYKIVQFVDVYFLLPCTLRCNVSTTELRRAAIHLLLSMLCLPLHFQDLAIKGQVFNNK